MAEVAGLVLGVLPLLVSKLEYYERFSSCILTYRKISKHITEFQGKLQI